jgi:hypothetical protein
MNEPKQTKQQEGHSSAPSGVKKGSEKVLMGRPSKLLKSGIRLSYPGNPSVPRSSLNYPAKG